jgi:hypothetical protein
MKRTIIKKEKLLMMTACNMLRIMTASTLRSDKIIKEILMNSLSFALILLRKIKDKEIREVIGLI